MRFLAVLALPLAGCGSVWKVDEVGPVRYVIRTSLIGICGSSSSTLETPSGRTLVDHAWNFSGQHSTSPDGKRMLVVGRSHGRLYRLHLVDLAELKVISAVDLPEADREADFGGWLGPWSPDGRQALLEIQAPGDGETQFWTVAIEGLRLRPLHQEPHPRAARLSWSPDGASVAVVIGVGGRSSSAEGWKLLRISLGSPPAVREVARIQANLLRGRIEWDGATPRFREGE